MKSLNPTSQRGKDRATTMPAILIAATTVCVLAWVATAAFAQSPAPVKKTGYDNYKVMQTRNIFDPNRRPYVASMGPPRINYGGNRPPTTERAQPDYITLTGIMMTEEKTLAFFAGNRADFNKVLGVDSSIAGATIKRITSSNIEIERDGKTIVIAVGQTVPFDNNSEPGLPPTQVMPDSVVASGAPAPVDGPATPGTAAVPANPTDPQAVSAAVPIGTSDGIPVATPGTNTPAPAGDQSEIIRRMIERRNQQLK